MFVMFVTTAIKLYAVYIQRFHSIKNISCVFLLKKREKQQLSYVTLFILLLSQTVRLFGVIILY